jgi:chromatin segregation and condensation protein Rec8/ScpA/Scc1 (kleisin family)
MTETTFEDVYSEVKKVNRRLDSMEKTLRALMTMLLPEEEISEEEWREITAIDEEMVKGECTTRARATARFW